MVPESELPVYGVLGNLALSCVALSVLRGLQATQDFRIRGKIPLPILIHTMDVLRLLKQERPLALRCSSFFRLRVCAY